MVESQGFEGLFAGIRRDDITLLNALGTHRPQTATELRGMLGDLEKDYPHLKETLLSAMGKIETDRLLDPRFLDLDGATEAAETANPFAIVD